MCTLAIYREVSARYPLVVAANRDEFYERETLPPARLSDLSGIVAGRDCEAGGTWLGCRVDGPVLVAGLLNRRRGDAGVVTAPDQRSRGLLCLDALGMESATAAIDSVDEEAARSYAGFNLLVADALRAAVIDNATGLRVTELETGLSVLTNLDVNDPRCPRLASAVPGFESVVPLMQAGEPSEAIVGKLSKVLGDHRNTVDPRDENPLARLCVHTPSYGTRSATVVLADSNGRVEYHHAPGPPCRTPFRLVET